MITAYHRPKTIEDALHLLERKNVKTKIIGGGASFVTRRYREDIEVVDLQNLNMGECVLAEDTYIVGSSATLQNLSNSAKIHPAIREAIRQDVSTNIQNRATIAGFLATSDGRSAFATLMLALDARLKWQPGEVFVTLREWLPARKKWKNATIIEQITIPLPEEIKIDSIARSPLDRPIICVAVVKFGDKLRVAIGGYGDEPCLVYEGKFDANFILNQVRKTCSNWGDEWASGEYRQNIAEVITSRLLGEYYEVYHGN